MLPYLVDCLGEVLVGVLAGRVLLEQVVEVGEHLLDGGTVLVGRTLQGLLHPGEALVEQLSAKGVALRILDPDINTGGPMGKLVLTMLGAIAEFERAIMLERQREGIDKAKREGKFKGRKPTARAKADDIRQLSARGLGATEIARELGIGRQSVYRILGDSAAGTPSSLLG